MNLHVDLYWGTLLDTYCLTVLAYVPSIRPINTLIMNPLQHAHRLSTLMTFLLHAYAHVVTFAVYANISDTHYTHPSDTLYTPILFITTIHNLEGAYKHPLWKKNLASAKNLLF